MCYLAVWMQAGGGVSSVKVYVERAEASSSWFTARIPHVRQFAPAPTG